MNPSKNVRFGEELFIGERGRDIGRGDTGEEGHYICDTATQNSEQSNTAESGTSGLSSGIHQLSGNREDTTKRTRELPTWLSKDGKDLEQQYIEGFEKRCHRIFGELQKSDGQLVRDVFRFQDEKQFNDLLRCLQNDEHYSRGLLQLCREDTHVHIAHDCSFSNGTCRCNWYQKAKTFGLDRFRDKCGHRRNSSRSRTYTDIQKLLIYYCTKGRSLVFQKYCGQVVGLPSGGYDLSDGGLARLSELSPNVATQTSGGDFQLQEEFQNLENDEHAHAPPTDLPRRKKRKVGAQERLQLKVIEVLEQHPICPPEAIVKHPVWRKIPELRFKDLTCKEVKIAINCFKDQLTTYSFQDFEKMYNNVDCVPVFSAGYGNFESYYYNVENSVKIMRELIEYQFNNDLEAMYDFVETLYNVLERKLPKLNTLVVHSPPSAGKNFFFDAIRSYYINSGHLCNANKYNNFPFQDAEGRRLVFWNEPNYSPEFLEPIKEILGGDSTNVNVKYQHDTPVYRTPVIVTTNNRVSFMNHEAFRDRIKIYHWSSAPYLKDYDKKPNPLAVYPFFKSYDMVK